MNGLEMYYEVHGIGKPVVLLHGSFMTITNNWPTMIAALSTTRQVIAVEMQAHGRTADIDREFGYEALADDIAALLDFLELEKADLIGYSLGGGVAMQVAIRHPEKVRKVVSISAVFRKDGLVQEALDAFPLITPDAFKGSPIEAEYRKLSPTPNAFPTFVKRVIAPELTQYDFGAEKFKATTAPFFFIHGDATSWTGALLPVVMAGVRPNAKVLLRARAHHCGIATSAERSSVATQTLASRVENANFLCQTSDEYVALLPEIEPRLEVEAKPLAGSEIAREAKRRVRAHRPLAVHDLVDPPRGYRNVLGGPVRGTRASGIERRLTHSTRSGDESQKPFAGLQRVAT